MLRLTLLLWAVMLAALLFGQVDAPQAPPPSEDAEETSPVQDELDPRPFPLGEVLPSFPGGEKALAAYMVKEVTYPKKAKKAGIEGKVIVGFVVDKDGAVTDAKVIRGVDPLLDAEALRAVQAMPKWIPGTVNGKPVKVFFNLPVRFKLKD